MSLSSKRILTTTCVLISLLCNSSIQAQDKAPEIVEQKSINEYACGPCAILNALHFANGNFEFETTKLVGTNDTERVQAIIAKSGSLPSLVHDNSKRFNGRYTGMAPTDLVATFNEVLKEIDSAVRVQGLYLNRKPNESPIGNLRRTHGMLKASIDLGLPVVFSVRGFAGGRAKDDKEKFIWNALTTHYVTVAAVQKSMAANEKGFSFQYLDPQTGMREFGYMHIDEARNFTAAKGNAEKWEWLKDRPFPVITSPSFRLLTQSQKFHVRTVITANYAIVPDSVTREFEQRIFDSTVEVACGQCQFNMKGEGCTLAIRNGAKSYYAEGTDIDAHGDAHGDDGFCNCIRSARVSGVIKDGKCVIEQFELLPQRQKKGDPNGANQSSQ